MGAVFLEENQWLAGLWDPPFIEEQEPSIEFLELYALTMAVLTWGKLPSMINHRVTIFCDNESVVYMINNQASSCPQCRKLLRLLALDNIHANRRLFARHVVTSQNSLADSLSRNNYVKFWKLAPSTMSRSADRMPPKYWPPQKVWFQDNTNDLLSL